MADMRNPFGDFRSTADPTLHADPNKFRVSSDQPKLLISSDGIPFTSSLEGFTSCTPILCYSTGSYRESAYTPNGIYPGHGKLFTGAINISMLNGPWIPPIEEALTCQKIIPIISIYDVTHVNNEISITDTFDFTLCRIVEFQDQRDAITSISHFQFAFSKVSHYHKALNTEGLIQGYTATEIDNLKAVNNTQAETTAKEKTE